MTACASKHKLRDQFRYLRCVCVYQNLPQTIAVDFGISTGENSSDLINVAIPILQFLNYLPFLTTPTIFLMIIDGPYIRSFS